MKALKGIVVVTTIIAAAAVLCACEKSYKDYPMKSDAGGFAVENTVG